MTSEKKSEGHRDIRVESDLLGEISLPEDVYYGIHTKRAMDNFPISGECTAPEFIYAMARVKQACAMANKETGFLDPEKAILIVRTCEEILTGNYNDQFPTDPFQGGAGTSTNMNVNEVIASRANELSGRKPWDYSFIHPLHHVNMHQSTNDVYPTALKVASLEMLKTLEQRVSVLQSRLQEKEQEFGKILKIGRTELMDAVPMTLGMTFGAWSECVARDRWRIFKCRERIKQVNLGGTAVGTGLGAPRKYIFRAAEILKNLTGLAVSRSENLMDATQNLDCFVEVSGMLKTYASNLIKISSDLRLMGSGPDTGFSEIVLPPVQAGSSIMAGKVNPVIPEAVTQVGLQVMGNDHTLTMASSMGQLELNHLMPLVNHTLLGSLNLLNGVTRVFSEKCISGIKAKPENCKGHVDRAKTTATVLVPVEGYKTVEKLMKKAEETGMSIIDTAVSEGISDRDTLEKLLSPAQMHKLGF